MTLLKSACHARTLLSRPEPVDFPPSSTMTRSTNAINVINHGKPMHAILPSLPIVLLLGVVLSLWCGDRVFRRFDAVVMTYADGSAR